MSNASLKSEICNFVFTNERESYLREFYHDYSTLQQLKNNYHCLYFQQRFTSWIVLQDTPFTSSYSWIVLQDTPFTPSCTILCILYKAEHSKVLWENNLAIKLSMRPTYPIWFGIWWFLTVFVHFFHHFCFVRC
jgi:hypothetical protein